jgi:5-formyltetrahydrofolate cyclo-ligase
MIRKEQTLISKLELRKHIKALHDSYDEVKLNIKSIDLQKKVMSLEEYQKSKSVFCYISFGKEIGTNLILEDCIKTGKLLSVPLITGKRKMIACRLDDINSLKKNKYGIMEPVIINEMPHDMIDLAIIPALGFNKEGFRIGHGGGFYDIYLKDFKGMSVGMTLSEFMADFIPEDHDIAVKKLVIL